MSEKIEQVARALREHHSAVTARCGAFYFDGEAGEMARAAMEAMGEPMTHSQGLAWFEQTFGVPLGDKPGSLDVARVRAMIGATLNKPAPCALCGLHAGACAWTGGRTERFTDCPANSVAGG